MSSPRWLLLALCLSSFAAQPQTNTDAMQPCDRDPFRLFDFWLGSWEVRDQTGRLAGHNTITAEQGGCVIIEKWQSVDGNGGMSMNYYEPRSGHWKQNWVSPGLILEMSGGLQGDSLVLEGPMHYLAKNEPALLRGTWTPLPDGRVRQHFVESKDGGKTWLEWFDGYYKRIDN